MLTEGEVGSFIQNIKGKRKRDKLTLPQKEVLQLLAEGRSMKEVAFKLNVSPPTVAFHKYTIMDQLRFAHQCRAHSVCRERIDNGLDAAAVAYCFQDDSIEFTRLARKIDVD